MYTIQQRQIIKERLANAASFEADCRLFEHIFPNHPLRRELQLVNNFNRMRLSRQMLYVLLSRLTEEDILANRQDTQEGPAVPDSQTNQEKHEVPAEATKPRRSKQEEFPDIPWDNNSDADIQLCILLYDERVNTYHRMQQIDTRLDEHPELATEMAALDERNRQAQQELETWQATHRFSMVHPIVINALQEKKQFEELRRIATEDSAEFMRRITNAKQNLRRIESRLNKQQYKDEAQRLAWEQNRDKAKRLLALMQQCI